MSIDMLFNKRIYFLVGIVFFITVQSSYTMRKRTRDVAIVKEKDEKKRRLDLFCALVDQQAVADLINVQDEETGLTPLHAAIIESDIERVNFFLKRGADLDVRVTKGEHDAYCAWQLGFFATSAVRDLFEWYSDWRNRVSNDIVRSANIGHHQAIKTLIARGVDVNQQDEKGDTALICATKNGDLSLVKILVQAGAQCMIPTSRGITAVSVARGKGHRHILDYFEFVEPSCGKLAIVIPPGADNVEPSCGKLPIIVSPGADNSEV
jgi:hypothetical protein